MYTRVHQIIKYNYFAVWIWRILYLEIISYIIIKKKKKMVLIIYRYLPKYITSLLRYLLVSNW